MKPGASVVLIGTATLCITQLAEVFAIPIPVTLHQIETSSSESSPVNSPRGKAANNHRPIHSNERKGLNPNAEPFVPRKTSVDPFAPDPDEWKRRMDFLNSKRAEYMRDIGQDSKLAKDIPAFIIPPEMYHRYGISPSPASATGTSGHSSQGSHSANVHSHSSSKSSHTQSQGDSSAHASTSNPPSSITSDYNSNAGKSVDEERKNTHHLTRAEKLVLRNNRRQALKRQQKALSRAQSHDGDDRAEGRHDTNRHSMKADPHHKIVSEESATNKLQKSEPEKYAHERKAQHRAHHTLTTAPDQESKDQGIEKPRGKATELGNAQYPMHTTGKWMKGKKWRLLKRPEVSSASSASLSEATSDAGIHILEDHKVSPPSHVKSNSDKEEPLSASFKLAPLPLHHVTDSSHLVKTDEDSKENDSKSPLQSPRLSLKEITSSDTPILAPSTPKRLSGYTSSDRESFHTAKSGSPPPTNGASEKGKGLVTDINLDEGINSANPSKSKKKSRGKGRRRGKATASGPPARQQDEENIDKILGE